MSTFGQEFGLDSSFDPFSVASGHQSEGFRYGEFQSMDEIVRLQKAIAVQESTTDIANLQNYGSMQIQSLERTLSYIVQTVKHLKLLQDIPTSRAFQVLEEYSQQIGYGQSPEGQWLGQMESPTEIDPNALRKFATMSFVREMAKWSDVTGDINQPILQGETWAKESATMRLLRGLNASLYAGNPTLIPGQISGFQYIIEEDGGANNIIDARGAALQLDYFRQAAAVVNDEYGDPDMGKVYCSSGGAIAIDTMLENISSSSNATRFVMPTAGDTNALAIGYRVSEIRTGHGAFLPSIDINIAGLYESNGAPQRFDPSNLPNKIEGKTNPKAPNMPSFVVTTQAATVPNSQWAAGVTRPAAATYKYRVYAVNRFGYSQAATALDAGAVVVADGSNTITITADGNSEFPATSFVILSEQVAAKAIFRLVGKVAASGGVGSFVDLNQNIPGTTTLFILPFTTTGPERNYSLKRLSPYFFKPLAPIGMFGWGIGSLYCTPQVYKPRTFVLVKNVPIIGETASPTLMM